jgi:CHAP domain
MMKSSRSAFAFYGMLIVASTASLFSVSALPPTCEQKYADNCVLFIRECRGVPLPRPLETWDQKKRIINDYTPRVGSVAVIEIPSGKFKDYGHVALIKNVSYDRAGRPTSITVEEANYPTPGVRMRAGSPQSMRVAGYFKPGR